MAKNEQDSLKKMKIVHVLKSSIYSGAENVVLTIIRELKGKFDFVYIATDGPIRKKLEQEAVPFILLDKFAKKDLAKALEQCKPDLVHAHDFSATVLCSGIPGGFRLISHLHYDPPWVRSWNLKTLVYAMCYKRIERILAVSENAFDSMAFAKIYRKKLSVVGNPVDGKQIRRLAKKELPKSEGEACDVIFVGRFVKQKNPQRFIRIIHMIKKQFWPDIRVWMLGQGELWEECRQLIQDLELQENIELKGFAENPYAYIRRAHIMCVTSRWEGFGLVVIEANLLGVPVLSTDTSGCREILGKDSWELCKSDEEFVENLMEMNNHPEKYEIWKKWSVGRAEGFDNIGRYMAQMSQIYRK